METAKKIDMFPVINESKGDISPSYIPIKRSFFNHFLWKEKRTFSKCEAWLDLIQLARFEQSEAKELIGGKLISWKRGQLIGSIRFLGQRWNWGRHKVDDFLRMLKQEKMVSMDCSQGQTIITLLNYEAHNGERRSRGQHRGQQNPRQASVSTESGDNIGESQGTSGGQAGDKTNKDNKENKEEGLLGASAPELPANFKTWTKDQFRQTVSENKNELMAIGQTQQFICSEFFKYWTEPDHKGRMRFQLEKTWDTARRLQYWENRDLKK